MMASACRRGIQAGNGVRCDGVKHLPAESCPDFQMHVKICVHHFTRLQVRAVANAGILRAVISVYKVPASDCARV